MEKNPLISIRIMTYNHEKYIRDTIESCLSQTYKNIEICIADDCSTDNTIKIVKEYQKKYSNIKLFVQPVNLGQYSIAINGNTGRKMCRGEYIAILDGDERMYPERLEKQLNFLLSNPDFIAVSHKKLYIDEKGNELKQPKDHNLKEITTKDLILNGNLFKNCYLYKNIGLMADTSLKVMADWEAIIRLSMYGKLGYKHEYLTYKIIHEKSVTATRKKQFEEDRLLTLALLEHKFPHLIKYINRIRTKYYLSKYKETRKKEYLKVFFSSSILNQIWVIVNYFNKRN